MRHYEVRDVMTADPVTVTPATSIKDLAGILVKQRIGAVPVLTPQGRPVGLVAEADLLRKEQLQRDPDGPHSMHLTYRARRDIATAETAGEIMTAHPVTVRAGATVAEAARLMDQHQVRCLLVVDEGGKLLGVVSPRDLLRVFLRRDDDIGTEVINDVLASADLSTELGKTGTGVARGQLRIYLGAAPGVGKTYAMLAEGQRRRSRGTDVVVGLLETHGRKLTATMAEGLEIVPRRTMTHRGVTFTEMDLDAVLARHPQVVLIDELAHTNVPGCRNTKRWQDVDELLDVGIEVITTLNIQHLESLNDVAKQVTGVEQHETLPDAVARRADQIELVDMTPEALRRRMVHGNVYPPNRIEAALTHYFRPGNLTALRELALLWLADRVEEGLQRYRAEHGIAEQWETRERIVVAIAGEKGDEAVIRRAARIAARSPGSDLIAVHVSSDDGLVVAPAGALETQRALVVSVGGSFCEVPGDDIPETLLRFARAENATQMVLGASRRGRFLTLLTGKSIPTRIARRTEHIDVHLVSRDDKTWFRPSLARGLGALRLAPARGRAGERRGGGPDAARGQRAARARRPACAARGDTADVRPGRGQPARKPAERLGPLRGGQCRRAAAGGAGRRRGAAGQ